MTLHLEVVTPERLVYSDDVDGVQVPGSDGELGILPHHAPLVATLGSGELRIIKGSSEESIAVIGGFLQVRPDKVVVMAESADLAPEIDLEGAAAGTPDLSAARAELQRSLLRIRVAERRHREGPRSRG